MNPMRKTNMRMTLLAALASVGLAGVMSMMIANVASAQPAGGARQGPPPEALAACKSLASGATCEFSGPRGTVSGTCFAPQQDMPLACRPKDAPASEGAASGSKG
jgi:hypothetical protein